MAMITLVLLLFLLMVLPPKAVFAQLVDDTEDGYSMPAVFKPKDFTSLSRLFIQPAHSYARDDNFEVAEFDRVHYRNREWVKWHFVKRNGSNIMPSLAYRYSSYIPSMGYSAHVVNMGKMPVSLSGWGVTDSSQWVILKPGEEKIIRYAGTSAIVAQDTQPGKDYELYIRDLTLYYPEAKGIAVSSLQANNHFVAEQTVNIRVAISGSIEKQHIDLEVRQELWVVWRIRLNENERKRLDAAKVCVIERRVPWYLSPGRVSIGLVSDGLRVPGVEAHAVVSNRRRAVLPTMERKTVGGRPTFMLDGVPITWSGYATYTFAPGVIHEFANNGADLFHITCSAGRHYHNVAEPTWLGGNKYDYGEIEQMAATILQANPKARIIIRLALGLPPFWYNQNKSSLVKTQSAVDGKQLVWWETDSQVGSLTSEAWRQQQATALRNLVRYCATRPWSSQVIGFNIGGAMTEEWFAWASCDEIIKPVKYFGDYSDDNEHAFAAWCKTKGYPYTRVPDARLRDKPGYDVFPDDTHGKWVMAYNMFISEVSADTIKYFASVVKQETKRKSLVGVFYGYVVLLAGEARQSDSGNFGVRQILECDDVDYLGGVPQHYLRRLTGDGYAQNATAVGSVTHHGKQYMDDNDLFSWLHEGGWHTLYDEKDPRSGCIKMHRRWFATDALYGNAYEWFSLSPKWHHDAGVMDEFAKEAQIHNETLRGDRSPIEEVAFVIDDHSFGTLTPTAGTHYTNQSMLGTVGRSGAPMSVWLLSDVDKLPERIQFIAVVNATSPRTDDLEKLRGLIARGGRTIMVIGVPGMIDPQTLKWNIQQTEKLLNLPIRIDKEAMSGRACLSDGDAWLCPVIGSMLGDITTIRPRPYAVCSGFMKYSDGKTAGVIRDLDDGGKLIWCGVPPYASDQWMSEQIAKSGVHMYAPYSCSVHATKDYVSVTSVYEDDRSIDLTWPEDVRIVDMFDGWRGEGRVINCPFTHGQTRLFHIIRL